MFMSVNEAAKKWGISDRRVRILCSEGKISGEKITYILNNNTMKYHRTDCARAKDILEKNRENTTLSKKKLEAAGYEPCGFCKP